MIEGGDAIRGDEQERFADGVEIAHLAASEQREAGEIGLGECLQRVLLPGVICTAVFLDFQRAVGLCQRDGCIEKDGEQIEQTERRLRRPSPKTASFPPEVVSERYLLGCNG